MKMLKIFSAPEGLFRSHSRLLILTITIAGLTAVSTRGQSDISEDRPWHQPVPVMSDSAILLDTARNRLDESMPSRTDSADSRPVVPNDFSGAMGSGTFKGAVISNETGEPIAGVSININRDSLRFSFRTDADGLFTFRDIPPGIYSFMAYKKGFEQFKSTAWSIAPGPNAFREIKMDRKILKGSLMEIKAPVSSASSQRLLAGRRQTSVVMEGVSAEQISKSTDSDAGAIARRVTGTSVVGGKYVYVRGLGERYTNMTLNGLPVPTPEKDKRVVPQDLFPADVIENFIIYKTLSPDLMTDFAGGSLNLITKGIPSSDFFKASVSSGAKDNLGDGRFLALGKNRLTYANGDAGWENYFGLPSESRRIPEGVPTIITPTMGQDSIADFARKFDNRWRTDTSSILPDQSYALSTGKVWDLGNKTRTGFLAHLNFKNNYDQRELTKIKVGISPLQHYATRRYTLKDTVIELQVLQTVFDKFPSQENPSVQDSARLQVIQRGIEQHYSTGIYKATASAMVNFGYESPDHYFWFKSLYASIADDKTIFNRSVKDSAVMVSLGQEDDIEERFLLEYQRRSILTGQAGGGHFLGFSVFDSLTWAASLARTTGQIPDSRKYFYIRRDSTTIEYDTKQPYGTRQYDDFSEIGAAGRFDFFWVIPPSLSKQDLFLKGRKWFSDLLLPGGRFGMLSSFKQRRYDIIQYQWETDFLDRETVLQDTTNDYALVERLYHPDSVYRRVLEDGAGFQSAFNDFDNYTAMDLSLAGYFGVNTSFKLLSFPADLNAGGRYEFYLLNFKAPFSGQEGGTPKPDWNIRNTDHYFYPSAGVGFEFVPRTKLRALYSSSLVRPEVRERAPLFFFDSEDEIEVIGNPELKDTRIHNYDLRFDWFFSHGQLLSASAFYKKFKDPVEYIVDYNLSPNRKIFQNAPEAYVTGIELEADINLYRLTNEFYFMHGFQFYANAAWMRSRVVLDTSSSGAKLVTSKSRSMMGQSPYLYNCKLTHEKSWGRVDVLNGLLFNMAGRRIHSLGIFYISDTYEEAFPSLDYLAKLTLGKYEASFKVKNLLNAEEKYTISEYNHTIDYHSLSDGERDELYKDKPRTYVVSRYKPGISYSLGISAKF